MSEPIDDKALDEYLKGGSLVSQRYRELGADEVPAELNRRVLDQARAAVAKRPAKSRTWMRWSAPVALAASAVLVLSIVIDSGVRDGDVVMAPAPVRQESPAAPGAGASERESSGAASADVRVDAPKQAEQVVQPELLRFETPPAEAEPLSARRMTEKKKEGAGVADRLQKSVPPAYSAAPVAPTPTVASTAAAPPPSVASSAARAEAQLEDRSAEPIEQITATAQQRRPVMHESASSISVEEAIVTGTRRRDARNVGPRDTVRASSGQAFSSDTDEQDETPRTYSDPERWLEDIRQLRKDGETAQADREWERFRATFPDYPVADTDLAKRK